MAGKLAPQTVEKHSTQTTQECPECSGSLHTNTGEVVCRDCGLVIEADTIDPGKEWREFDDRDSRARTGSPLTVSRHDNGLNTVMGTRKDGHGHDLTARQRRHYRRLERQHSKTTTGSKRDRNKIYAFTEIRRFTSAFDAGRDLRDRASAIFRTAHDNGLLKGRSLDSMSAGAFYAACRERGRSVTPADVAEYARCDTSAVFQAFATLDRELGLSSTPFSPVDHVPRLASTLGLPRRDLEAARRVASRAVEAGFTNGVSPSAFAAACIYYVTGGEVTQARAADVAGATASTVRKHYRALAESAIPANPGR